MALSVLTESIRPAAALVVAGVSCSGKDEIARGLLWARPELRKAVTTTTRPPRDYEVNGQHYHFVSRDVFEEKIRRDEFLEWAIVHGQHYYGLTRQEFERIREMGYIPFVILDVQGVKTIRSKLDIVTVFVTAPIEDIERRLRANRPPEEIPSRLASLDRELAEAANFDVVIDNPDGKLNDALRTLIQFYDTVARPRLQAKTRTSQRSTLRTRS